MGKSKRKSKRKAWWEAEDAVETKVFNGTSCERSKVFNDLWYDHKSRKYFKDNGKEEFPSYENIPRKKDKHQPALTGDYHGSDYYGSGYGGSYSGGYGKNKGDLISDEIDDIVNPYGDDKHAKQNFRQFADILSPTYDVSFKEGKKWRRNWLNRTIEYVVGHKKKEIESQMLLLNSLANFKLGSEPELPKGALRLTNKEARLKKDNSYLTEDDGEKLAEKIKREMLLKEIVGKIDERRTSGSIIKEFGIASKYIGVLTKYWTRESGEHHKKLLKVKAKLKRSKAGKLEYLFKKTIKYKGDSDSEPLKTNIELREKVRDLLIREVISAYLNNQPKRGWINEQKLAHEALVNVEDKLNKAKSTADVAKAISAAYNGGLKKLINGSELTAEDRMGFNGSPTSSTAALKDLLNGKEHTPETTMGKSVGKEAGKEKGAHELTLNNLVAQLRHKIRDLFADNERKQHYGHYRSGKILTRELFKHRTGNIRLFQRKIVKDIKDYHVLMTVDTSGSTFGRFASVSSGSVYHEELKCVVALLKACENIPRLKFTLHLFDTRVEKIFVSLSAKDALKKISADNFELPQMGGGTAIPRALLRLRESLTPNCHNISFVLTDGQDNAERTTEEWKKLLKDNDGWAFVYCSRGYRGGASTFSGINVTEIETTQDFAIGVKSALIKILGKHLS